MPQNTNFMIGRNSPKLTALDFTFAYQNLTDFQLFTGPSLEEIVAGLEHEKYEIEKPKNNDYSPSSISKIIWDYLNSRPGKIRHSGSKSNYGLDEAKYMMQINESVKRGQPVQLFFMNFSPKFSTPLISGYDVLPDLSNLIALQHLVDIATPIYRVYEPGIQFVIAYEGGIYQDLGKFSDEEVNQTYSQIKQFVRLIEERTGQSGILKIVDGKKLMEGLGPDFIQHLREEERRLSGLYENKTDFDFINKFDEWRSNFALSIVDLNKLMRKRGEQRTLSLNEWVQVLTNSHLQHPFLQDVRKLLDETTYSLAIDYFAFHNIKYSSGKMGLGIKQEYPNAISITVRSDKKRLALQLIPGTSMYSHHGITVWTGERWEITRLIDLARYPNQFIGVVSPSQENLGRIPFYYLPKDNICPDFVKPIVTFEKEIFPDILSKKGYSLLTPLNSGGMDSKLFLAQDRVGKKVVIKYSTVEGFQGNGRPVLKQEAMRLERIVEELGKSQRLFPQICEYYDDENITYYVMEFIPDTRTVMNHLSEFCDREAYVRETRRIVNNLLTNLTETVYSRGSQETPEKYVSVWHLDRLRQGIDLLVNNQDEQLSHTLSDFFKKLFDYETITINGFEFLNFPKMLALIKENEDYINEQLNPKKIPRITHGDLHLGNVLINPNRELFLVDPHGRSPINAVESELGRIVLSFFAHFLMGGNYDVNTRFEDKRLITQLYYTGECSNLVLGMSDARDSMLEMLGNHEGIYEWVKNTGDWQSHVLLMEAIHIPVVAASKFKSDKSGRLTQACYLTGTILMNNVLSRMGIIDTRYGSIESPMEFFVPEGKYKFQQEQFIDSVPENKEGRRLTLDFILKSCEYVMKNG